MGTKEKIYWVVSALLLIPLLALLGFQFNIYIEYLNSRSPNRSEGLFAIALLSLYSIVLWGPGMFIGVYGVQELKKYWSLGLLLPSLIEGLIFVWALLD